MGFILGVLVIGALLSAIFGRRVGAMFVTGTVSVVLVCFGILLLLLSPLIWDYLHEPSHVGHVDMATYQPNYNTAAQSAAPSSYGTSANSYGSSGAAYASPVAQTPATSPPYQASSPNSSPVPSGTTEDYDNAIMSAANSAMSPSNWRCPTDPQARLQMADRYRDAARYIRQRAPYADPGKPGLYEDYAKECDHVASHLADLGESLAPNTTPLDLAR